jgi:NAD(P)-dependent dehydrogenase (short-subunit alcohol dehydrogenase family)
MSVAIIQGASGGQGLALTAHIIRNTGLKVYALTHGKGDAIKSAIGQEASDRLTVIPGVDLKEERGLEDAAKTVKEREGKAAVRLIACMAGIVRPNVPRPQPTIASQHRHR